MLRNIYYVVFSSDIRKRIWDMRQKIKFELKIKLEFILKYERYPYKRYCDQHRCIFIHIPKNAGTSIITLLNKNTFIEQEHNTYWDYFRSDYERFILYEKFCVIRNPWDRLLSAYQYLREGGNKGSDKYLVDVIKNECKDFNDFVMNWLTFDKIYNIKVLNPQFMYIYDLQNEKLMVDNILRFEHLWSDFSVIQKKLGIINDLPMINNSQHKQYNKYYTQEMIDIVAKFYNIDIKLFEYKFGEEYDS